MSDWDIADGQRLRAFRDKYGLTGDDIARRFHVTRQTVSLWELGNNGPHAEICAGVLELIEEIPKKAKAMSSNGKVDVSKLTFGERLRVLRKERRMSQFELVEELQREFPWMHISQTTLSVWENRTIPPNRRDVTEALSNFFGISLLPGTIAHTRDSVVRELCLLVQDLAYHIAMDDIDMAKRIIEGARAIARELLE